MIFCAEAGRHAGYPYFSRRWCQKGVGKLDESSLATAVGTKKPYNLAMINLKTYV